MHRLLALVTTVALVSSLGAIMTQLAAEEPRLPRMITPKKGVIKLFDGKDRSKLYTRLRDTGFQDPRRVFTVHDGLLHISGDGFGGIFTKDAYHDYHMIVEFKWGPRTWGSRRTQAKDSGVLFHATGPEDSFAGCWPEAFQAQMIHGGTGDLYAVKANGPVNLSLVAEVEQRDGKMYWKRGGEKRVFSRGGIFWFGKDPEWKNTLGFRGKNDIESPDGKWTRMDVICDGDNVVVKVNGVAVNEASGLTPSAGKIVIQCEGAELFVRRWELWPIGMDPDAGPPNRPAEATPPRGVESPKDGAPPKDDSSHPPARE